MYQKSLFEDAFLYQPSIIKRLIDEINEAFREFFQDPKAYLSSAVKGDGIGGKRRKMLLRFGLAMGIVIYAVFFGAILVLWTIHNRASAASPEDLEVKMMINPDDFKMQEVEMPKAEKRAGGGGGGGRNTPTPPSKGELPKFSLTPPVVAPRPEPQLKPPSLPVLPTVQVDPRLEPKRDDLAVTGLPTGVPGPPSAGPGSGGGMGAGSGGGMGPGDGTGLGPGRGFNTGGGDPRLGGGDYNADGSARAVDSKPIALNEPRPLYTEEARKNKIQGNVRARILVGSDGSVKQCRLTTHLPDGLDEQAIAAAYKLRFRPAIKDGRPVSFWVNVEIGFNLR
jgi:periplasmic protein TonB